MMEPPAPDRADLEATVATMFDVLGWEIELAGARSIQLDALMSEMIKHVPEERRGEFIQGLHLVDLLSQQLTGLSAFARKMGETVSLDLQSAAVGGALGEITLGALAERMNTALGGADRDESGRSQSGELDLF